MYLLNVFCTITRQKKVICLSRGWYDDGFMVILSVNIQNLCSP
ncbi:hypothetical protein [Escherichia phage ST2]|nr:hypothetical protein [Escherichia phage ST2]